ncbi:helix-turn-helix transcriptional regulator [Hymenobacter negativus]|uniref:Helix-turn-helix transcriptional regulator n=1 Tax=Hymenobacter negativus TaxID=2795026 RepID=A0ABS3QIH6_9BACT|nr:helix-turn-helix transcriptional regulator [Hymenobacter negativus]MBO2011036.1 helix-turn-helix transcriptional regulator [Hymenobacter negativus]
MSYTYHSETYGQPALETSAGREWPGLRVERFQLEAMALPAHFHAQHLLIIHQGSQPVSSSRRSGSRLEQDVFHFGDAGLYPGGEYGPISLDGPADVIHVHIDAGQLENRVRQSLDLTRVALRERFRFADGLLTQLGRQLLAAAGAEHALGLLYVESLTNALCYHLIEHHATFERRVAGTGARLPAPVLARIDAYLEASAEQTVTLEVLAGLANLSVFHFARRFKQTTGQSPYQYVLAWKIKRAQLLLRAGHLPMANISDALGFASPAHFSAAFKRAVGQSPREFQRT